MLKIMNEMGLSCTTHLDLVNSQVMQGSEGGCSYNIVYFRHDNKTAAN